MDDPNPDDDEDKPEYFERFSVAFLRSSLILALSERSSVISFALFRTGIGLESANGQQEQNTCTNRMEILTI